jgi:hypothetical protein
MLAKISDFVMPGLVPGIHVFDAASEKAWMAGTSPAMTDSRWILPISFVIPGRRAAAGPESIRRSAGVMDSGLAALRATPRNDAIIQSNLSSVNACLARVPTP